MEPEQPPAADDRCGTYPGYQLHTTLRTPPCEPCLDANRLYQNARRRALSRLAKLHRPELRALIAEERSKVMAGGVR